MNDDGAIVGILSSGHSQYLGFERDSSGGIASFSAVNFDNTFAVAINNNTQVTGYYSDSQRVYHGFVR
jgi:hypothetical protein